MHEEWDEYNRQYPNGHILPENEVPYVLDPYYLGEPVPGVHGELPANTAASETITANDII